MGVGRVHPLATSCFQSIERSFPRPTSMELRVLKFRVVIIADKCGSTMAEVA